MDKLLVSICIPVYNGARYLQECLDSVMAQTFEDFEVIAVDDGSTDDSQNILKSYQEKFPKLKVHINSTNLGLVGNWNRCLELAKGEWIKFVFQDDLISPECLSHMMKAASDTQALVVCQRKFLIEESASPYLKNYFTHEVLTLEKLFDDQVPGFIPARDVSKLAVKHICRNFIGEPSSVLFKRALVERLGPFDKDLAQICDLEYWLRIGSLYGIKHVHENLAFFRIHSSSTTSMNTGGKRFTSLFSDPAVYAYKLLHDPLFKLLRHSVSFFSKIRLGAYFRVKVYEAHLFLDSEEGKKTGGESAILKRNPEFENGKKPGLLVKLIYIMAKLMMNVKK